MIWAALAVPSWPVVFKLAGWIGVIVYSLLIGVAVAIAPRLASAIKRSYADALAAVTIAILIVAFAIVYPRVNTHVPGAGSDDDDAHDVGVAALLAGESPYLRQTYLGNELHQLPGSFILSAPFAIAGSSALQNLVCIALFFLVLRHERRDPVSALVSLWLALASAGVLHAILTGSSYPWNAIWVLLGLWLVIRYPASWWAPVFAGIALCSRPNFILLLAPLSVAMWRMHGARAAARVISISGLVSAGLVLPFDPFRSTFPPLEGFSRLSVLDGYMPGMGIAVLAITVIVTFASAVTVRDFNGLLRSSALILATPVICGLLIGALMDRDTMMSYPAYGLFATWFVAMLTDQPTRLAPT